MTSFVENSLISGEKIESQAVITWLSQFWLFLFSLILVMTVIVPILFITIAILNVVTTELAVTNKKILGKTGILRRASVDLPLNRLESINVYQGIIGRIFGFGKLSVRGIGGNSVTIPYVRKPLIFRRVVMNLMDKNSNLD
jgi:uncharacterized membrane protein YdbT with pleckstrin-like domain